MSNDYEHGDRVRDVRDGTIGTVHVFELDPRENPDEVVTAEVRWDGLATADELDVARPHLEPVSDDEMTEQEAVELAAWAREVGSHLERVANQACKDAGGALFPARRDDGQNHR